MLVALPTDIRIEHYEWRSGIAISIAASTRESIDDRDLRIRVAKLREPDMHVFAEERVLRNVVRLVNRELLGGQGGAGQAGTQAGHTLTIGMGADPECGQNPRDRDPKGAHWESY